MEAESQPLPNQEPGTLEYFLLIAGAVLVAAAIIVLVAQVT